MKRGITFTGLIAAFTVAVLFFVPFGLWFFGVQPPASKAAVPLPPSIAQIQNMSELATTRVHISDYIEGENNHYKGRWALHGEVVLGVDLSKASYVTTNPEKKEAVIRLPQPHIISSKIDHDRSEEVYVKATVWVPMSDRKMLRDEVWKQADHKIQRLGQEPGYMERAKVQAERALQKLFKGVGWSVEIEWE